MVSINATLPNPVGMRKHKTPQTVGYSAYALRMRTIDTKPILWQNVAALMRHHWGRENLTRLASEAKIGPGTATRIKEQKTSIGINVLESVANVFELQAWHLLTPNLDPTNPPVIYLSRDEAALYERFRTSARDLAALNGH